MSYIKTTWVDEIPAIVPVKYAVTGDTEGVISASATIAPVTSITAGTPLNATNLNHMETGIENAQIAADAAQVAADAAQLDADKGVYLYDLRDIVVWVSLNKLTPLTNTNKGGFPIPAKLNLGKLIGVSGRCKGGSTSGNVIMTVNNTTTAKNMLATNITIEAGEVSSLTATVQPTISADDGVTTDNWIEVACTQSGTGVTFAGVMLTFRPYEAP